MENTAKLTPEIARRILARMVDALADVDCECEPVIEEVEGYPGVIRMSCPHANMTGSRDEFERMYNSEVIDTLPVPTKGL